MSDKLKMKTKVLWAVFVPIIIVLVATCIVITAVMNYFSMTMDTYLGRGKRYVTAAENTEDWDTEYYKVSYTTTDGEKGSQMGTAKVVEEVGNEGCVLLKNTASTLPLAKNTSVSPFGFRYMSPVYGGSGSGNVDVSADYVYTAERALESVFNVNDKTVSAMEKAKVYGMNDSGYKEYTDVTGYEGASTEIGEYNPDEVYNTDEIKNSCKDTVGIVFIGRVGGEGADLLTTEYYDGTAHELALSSYEKQTIKFAKQNCAKVVVIVNSSNVMELKELSTKGGEYEADAILWVGGPGSLGFKSMANILCGDVNPSGKTPDIYAMDFTKDPTWNNFGVFNYDYTYDTVDRRFGTEAKGKNHTFIEYEEGVYVGYRYYETAYDINASGFTYGTLTADGSIAEEGSVLYPFGYGLSYTTFTQEIISFSETADEVELTVRVSNTGKVSGKDTVQIYYNPPYTSNDTAWYVEKPTANLVAYAKTDLIGGGDHSDITVIFAKEDMASYNYVRDNGDGTKGCYMLEEGDYEISLRANSHTVYDTETVTVNETIWYDNDNPRQTEKDAQSKWDDEGNPSNIPAKAEEDKDAEFVAAVNRFESVNDYMLNGPATMLTRGNWNGTQPTAPTNFTPSEKVIAETSKYGDMTGFDYETDELLGNVEGSKVYSSEMPTENADNGLLISNMRGLDYYDSQWNELLDQLDLSPDASGQLYTMLFATIYTTTALDAVGKPDTIDLDGPQGLTKNTQNGTFGANWCALCSAPVMAATFNIELAYKIGEAVGQEALTTGVNGWYAPGLNGHRSPFAGRNFEYYSEDPILAGIFGSYVVSGVADQGVYAMPKHFFLNEIESKRHSCCTWATEQTMREIYLKAFELCVKGARATLKYVSDADGTISTKVIRGCMGIMTSHNLIGGTHASCSYALNTEVLRDEWGFQGFVESDNCTSSNVDASIRSGQDMRMNVEGFNKTIKSNFIEDGTSATSKNVIRKAVKNICYVMANTNVMNGVAPGSVVTYGMSPWAIGLLIGNIVIYGFSVATVVLLILRTVNEKKNPDKYKH